MEVEAIRSNLLIVLDGVIVSILSRFNFNVAGYIVCLFVVEILIGLHIELNDIAALVLTNYSLDQSALIINFADAHHEITLV